MSESGKSPGFSRGSSHIAALQNGIAARGTIDGPTYIELRARGADSSDEADFIALIAWLLAKAGFESHPCDAHPPSCEVILPAHWRDLPIVRAALGRECSMRSRP